MGENITSIGGADIIPGEPDEYTILAFEELLERARSGEIVGAVCVLAHSDRSASYKYCGWFHGFTFMGAFSVARDHVRRMYRGDL